MIAVAVPWSQFVVAVNRGRNLNRDATSAFLLFFQFFVILEANIGPMIVFAYIFFHHQNIAQLFLGRDFSLAA